MIAREDAFKILSKDNEALALVYANIPEKLMLYVQRHLEFIFASEWRVVDSSKEAHFEFCSFHFVMYFRCPPDVGMTIV